MVGPPGPGHPLERRAAGAAGDRHGYHRPQTQRGELRRVNNIQSLILDNSVVGIALVRNRVFEFVNSRLAEMLCLTLDEILGSSTRILYPSNEVYEDMGRKAYTALSSGGWFEFETGIPCTDGTVFAARVLGKALNPARPMEGSVWLFENITDRKRAEEEREKLQAQLNQAQRLESVGHGGWSRPRFQQHARRHHRPRGFGPG